MTAIAQRRVAGATALMILLYLLQVALFAPSASAADVTYKFVFQNGVEITGSVTGGDATIEDSVFVDFYAPDPVPFDLPVSIHVSCSESYPGGWDPNGDFPNETLHSDWQISWYKIDKFAGQARSCGETFEKGSITVVKNTAPVTNESFAFELSGVLPPAPGSSGTDPIDYGPVGKSVAGDGGSETWSDLDAGAYELEELTASNPAGYSFSSVECVDDGSDVVVASPGANPAAFELAGGQHITCTFHNTSSTQPGVATVSVSGVCAVVDGVAQYTYTVTASEGVTVDFDGGDQNVTNGGTYVSASSSANWTATAPDGDLFSNESSTTSGTASVTDCTPPPPGEATVSVSGTCAVVQGVAQYTYTVTASAGVTVDFDGGDQNVANGGTYVSASSSANWTATAPVGDLFPNELSTTSGTASVTNCTPPPPPPPPSVTTTTTTTAPAEVAGTTITTVPEVSADTLPFTGFETGDTVRLGMLAMLAGGLMLFAVRGKKEEEGAVTDIGGWSNL